MSELIRYRPLGKRAEETASLGLLVFLASWTMLFAAALFAYGALRLSLPRWPPAGVAPASAGLPALGILPLLAASAAMRIGVWRIERGRPLELSAALILALLFGLLFLGLQVVFWHRLELAGIGLRDAYGASLYEVTVLEAIHVAVGVGAFGVLLSRSFDGRYSAPRHLPVKLWALYWDFLAAMWLVIVALVFLV